MGYKIAFEKKTYRLCYTYYESSFSDSLFLSSWILRVAAPFMADCSWLVGQLVGCCAVVLLGVCGMAMLFWASSLEFVLLSTF